MRQLKAVFSAILFAAVSFISAASVSAAEDNAAVIRAFSSKPAERIVCLSPAATEILCSIGAYSQIAARTDFSDWPPEVTRLPSVGGFDGRTLSIEKILAFRPQLVYASHGMHEYLADQLTGYGIKVYFSNAVSIDDVLAEITDMGQITGHADGAAMTVKHIRNVISGIKERLRKRPVVSVYWEIWNSPYMSAGSTSFMDGLITAAGGKNVFGDIAQAYPLISEESVIARKPEVIIIPDMEKETAASVIKRPGWNIIPAVKNDRIVFVNADLTARPGPRIAEAVLVLAEAVHPEVSFEGIK